MPSTRKIAEVNLIASTRDKTKRQKLLLDLFNGFNASSDYPGFAFLDDLLDLYPDCKIILNKRHSAAAWEKSIRSSLLFFSTPLYYWLCFWSPQSRAHYYLYATFIKLARERYGVEDAFSRECYEKHNEWVRQVAKAKGKEVLEWRPEDGLEPLCRFLGRDVPKDVVLPKTNEGGEIERLKGVLVRRGLLYWALVLGLMGLGVWLGGRVYHYG
jgi:hypothetical protein